MRVAIETDVYQALAELWGTLWPIDQLIFGVGLAHRHKRCANN